MPDRTTACARGSARSGAVAPRRAGSAWWLSGRGRARRWPLEPPAFRCRNPAFGDSVGVVGSKRRGSQGQPGSPRSLRRATPLMSATGAGRRPASRSLSGLCSRRLRRALRPVTNEASSLARYATLAATSVARTQQSGACPNGPTGGTAAPRAAARRAAGCPPAAHRMPPGSAPYTPRPPAEAQPGAAPRAWSAPPATPPASRTVTIARRSLRTSLVMNV